MGIAIRDSPSSPSGIARRLPLGAADASGRRLDRKFRFYMRVEFLAKQVWLAGELEKDRFVVLIKRGEELAGFFCCTRDPDMLALHVRFAIVTLAESIGRAMGIGMVNAMATLKLPFPQQAFGALRLKPSAERLAPLFR